MARNWNFLSGAAFAATLATLTLLGFSRADAVTIHVTADGLGDAPTIRDAIAMASTGDVVEIARGTYHESEIDAAKNIVITGASDPNLWPTIDGGGAGVIFRIYDVSSGPAFHNLHLTNAGTGIIGRGTTPQRPGPTWSADHMLLDHFTESALDADHYSAKSGSATWSDMTIDNCFVALRLNDANVVTATRLIIVDCQSLYELINFNQFTLSCSVEHGNGAASTDHTGSVSTSQVITADAGFCDAATGNFRLIESSPGQPANNACGQLYGGIGGGCSNWVGVGPTAWPAAPVALMLGEPHPNPVAHRLAFDYATARNSHVTIALYDLAGRRVELLVDAEVKAGTHHVEHTLGRPAYASQLLFLVCRSEGERRSARVVVLR